MTPSMNDEMRKALEADGEKLRQMTGQDHGPVWKCAGCGKPGLEHCCDCVTDVVCRVTDTTHEHAVKTPRPKDTGQPPHALSHDDACRLSRAFNQVAHLSDPQDCRINEWLKREISNSLKGYGP